MFSILLCAIWTVRNTHVNAQVEYINNNNNLTTIPTEAPSNIQILNLEHNQLEQLLEGSLDQFTNLQEIYLKSNLIETLENNVFNPSIHQNLRLISMGNNRVTEMPVLHGFQMLRILDVSNNELQTITIGKLDNLEELILNGNKFNSMPVLMELLPSLHTIMLSHNEIVMISGDYFNRSPSLKTMDISRNSLQEITLGQADSLMEIRLSHNNLNVMPVLTKPLPSLTKMIVNDNPISSINDDYFINTPALLILNLNQTKLTEFNCTELSLLRQLYLDNTLLAQFPNITDCFASLRVLRLQYIGNHLTTPGIDKALAFGSTLTTREAPFLNTFYLRFTHIGDLPSWFLYAVPNLQYMDIAETKLTEMPDISRNDK